MITQCGFPVAVLTIMLIAYVFLVPGLVAEILLVLFFVCNTV